MDEIRHYRELHVSDSRYGGGVEHAPYVAMLLEMAKAKSVLDWGCGKGAMANELTSLGYEWSGYDPAIPELAEIPQETFDAVICLDVLEHIPEEHLEEVLKNIAERASVAILVPHLGLAKTTLPDGRNAHCTIKSKNEWKAEFERYFSVVEGLPHHNEFHGLFWCSTGRNVSDVARAQCSRLASRNRRFRLFSRLTLVRGSVKILTGVLGELNAGRVLSPIVRRIKGP